MICDDELLLRVLGLALRIVENDWTYCEGHDLDTELHTPWYLWNTWEQAERAHGIIS